MKLMSESAIAALLVDNKKPNVSRVKMIVLIELRLLTQPTEFLSAIYL